MIVVKFPHDLGVRELKWKTASIFAFHDFQTKEGYTIRCVAENGWKVAGNGLHEYHPTLDAAKIAAQSHYAQKILGAIHTAA